MVQFKENLEERIKGINAQMEKMKSDFQLLQGQYNEACYLLAEFEKETEFLFMFRM